MQQDVQKRTHIQPSMPSVEDLPSHAITLGVPADEIFRRGVCKLQLEGEPDVDEHSFILVEDGRALGVVAFGKQQIVQSGRGHKVSKGYPVTVTARFAAPLATNVPKGATGIVKNVAVKVPPPKLGETLGMPVVATNASKSAPVSKPFAGFGDFAECVTAQRDKGHDEESARAICGELQAEAEKAVGAVMPKPPPPTPAELLAMLEGVTIKVEPATPAEDALGADPKTARKKPRTYTKTDVLEICKAAIRKQDPEVIDPDVNLAGEGGIHQHNLDRPNQTTANDGEHQHIFVLPDGVVVGTMKDGAHMAMLAAPAADVSEPGGTAHSHEIVLPDGDTAPTSSDGEHMHALQVGKSAVDGLHQHEYELADGTVLQSLTPGQFWEQFGDAPSEGKELTGGEPGGPVQVDASLTAKLTSIHGAVEGLKMRTPALSLLDSDDDSITIQVHRGISLGVQRSIEDELAKRLPGDVASRLRLVGDDFGAPAVASTPLAKLVVEFGETFERVPAPEGDEGLNVMPQGKQRAAMQYVFDAAGQFFTVVRMQADDQLVTWSLETARGDNLQSTINTVRDAEAVIESANVDGSRYHRPIRGALVKASPAVSDSLVMLDREGKVHGAEDRFVATTVDRPVVEYGLQRDGFHEYFLSGSSVLKGALVCINDGMGWQATVRKSCLPAVLTAEAVEQGVMPPLGRSALPSMLEREIDPDLHYWRATTDKAAQQIRDALVKARLLTDANVVLYEGEFRVMHAKVERAVRKDLPAPMPATAPPPVPPVELDPVQRVAAMLPGAGADVVLFDRALSKTMGPEDVASAASNLDGEDFLVAFPDSPGARLALAKCGQLFKLAGHAATIFVTSSPFRQAHGIEWLPDPAPLLADAMSDQVAALFKRMGDVHNVPILKAEERFVYGIVLEPETVDAQNDIYGAEEVRKAAHIYMQEFGHIKLMHNGAFIDTKVKILESFVAPVAFQMDGQHVKKGTWLLAVRVLCDQLWEAIKSGDLTGFSIGGTAIKTPTS